MPGQIKGITIEYDGNTTKLQTALNKVKAESVSVESEIRKINQNLKFDPKNTELLATKQQLLKQRIEQAKTQLSDFRKIQNQLNAQKVDKTSVEYLKVRRAVAEAEGKVRTFNAQLARAQWQGVTNLGKGIKSVGQQLSGATRYARMFTAALAGIALYKGFERLKSLDETSKQLEVLGYRGEELEKVMNGVTASVDGTRFMLQDMAKVASGALGSGVTDKYELNEYLTRTADLAQLAGIDVNSMGAIMNKAYAKGKIDARTLNQLNQRGIPIYKLLQKQLNVNSEELTKLTRSGKVGFDDLYKATNRYQGLAQKMGTETLPGALTVLQQQFGLIGADFLSGVYEPLKDGTKGLVASIKTLRKDGTFKEWGKDLGDTVKYFITYFKEGEASMTGMSDRARGLATSIGPLIKTIGGLVEGFSKLPPQMQGVLVLGALFGGPVLSGVGSAITGFSTLATNIQTLGMNAQAGVLATGKLTSSVGALNGAVGLLLNPLTLGTLAVGAWAGGIYKMYQETHKATIEFDKFKEAAEANISATQAQGAQVDIYKQKLDELISKEHKSASDKALIKTYVEKLNGAVSGLNLKYNEEKDKLNQTSKAIEKKIENYKKAALVKAYEDQITEAAKKEAEAQMELEKLYEEQTEIKKKWADSTDHSRVAQVGFDAQMAKNTEKIRDQKKALKQAEKSMNDWANKAAEASGQTKKSMKSASTAAGKEGKELPAKYSAGIKAGESRVKRASDSLGKKAKDGLDVNTRSLGHDFSNGFAGGILDRAKSIAQAAADVVKKAVKAAKSAQKSGSPSKVMREVGREYGQGYTLGIGDEATAAIRASHNLVSSAVGAATVPARSIMASAPAGSAGVGSVVNNNTFNINSENAYDIANEIAITLEEISRAE